MASPDPRHHPHHDPEGRPQLDCIERLDDDQSFLVDDAFRAGAVRRGRELRRRRHVATGALSVLVVAILLTGGLGGYARWKASRFQRIAIGSIPQVDAGGAPTPAAANPIDLKAPFNVLVIGTDDLPGPGRDAGGRGDSMMIVHVDMQANAIRVSSLPRDLWVNLADGSGWDRLNVAVQRSPEVLIRTVNQTFGVRIDHFVLVNGANMITLVDAVGGVPLEIERALRDPNTGLSLDAGCRVLSGEQALALARSRHLQVQQPDGRFVEDQTADFGRARRQQILSEALVRQAGRHGTSLGGFTGLAQLATEKLVLDDNLGVSDLVDLARWSQGLPEGSVLGTIPAVTARITPEGGAVLDLAPGSAEALRAYLETGTTPNPVTQPTIPANPGTPAPVPLSAAVQALAQPIRVHPAATC